MSALREHAHAILRAALAAADAGDAVRRAGRVEGEVLTVMASEELHLDRAERILLLAAGKAAVPMALAAREVLGYRIAGGSIATKHGHARAVPGIETWEAGHPVPDANGLAAAADALELARGATERDLVLCLLSGGASALWPAPPPGVSLTELQALTSALLRCGATIGEVNAVRKHLSRISGGWLARALHPATVVTLAVSDVVGSPLDVIASGPTVADPTTFADALEVVARYEVENAAPRALAWLRAGAAGRAPETPKLFDRAFDQATAHVIASNEDALRGARDEAARLGYRAEIVAGDMEGEARGVAHQVAELALDRQRTLAPGGAPLALILGGETTVTVAGSGRGGRNQEMALALALELDGRTGIVAAALGTDGTDGPTDAAGGLVDGGTAARAAALGRDARDDLARNDSHAFLRAAGDLLVTGPTGTNVADVVLVLIEPPA